MAKTLTYKDIPPHLLPAVKEQAAMDGVTQKAWIIEALESYLGMLNNVTIGCGYIIGEVSWVVNKEERKKK